MPSGDDRRLLHFCLTRLNAVFVKCDREEPTPPLHALTLLNDRTSLEASEVLANAVDLQEKSIEIGISFLTKRILSRDPLPEEQIVIEREFTSTLNYYRQHPQQAFELVNIKQLPRQPTDQDAELAAWMVTASMIYNLDEAITHE